MTQSIRHKIQKKTRRSVNTIVPVSICSYNIQMTMFHITQQRLMLIVNELQRMTADVICLQECFEETAIHTICDTLKSIYKYSYNDTQDKPFYNTNSGLVILSKYPLQNVHYERYTHHKFVDSLAHKGFVCCEVVTPSHRLVLCNTHLQADYPLLNYALVRKEQLHQLCRFVGRSYLNPKRNQKQFPIVMCGDWNIPMHSESSDMHHCAPTLYPGPHRREWLSTSTDTCCARGSLLRPTRHACNAAARQDPASNASIGVFMYCLLLCYR